jgi:hypothetical protein
MPTSFLNLVDDNGTNTTGTLIDKAEFQALLMGTVPTTQTNTGAVNNWAPGVDGHTFTRWAGASDATFSGCTGGQAGLLHVVKNTGTKVGYFLHASGLSSAANQFSNTATSGPTPIAPGGSVAYRHDGTLWQLVGHDQGDWITPTFAAGNYVGSGSMTWTLTSPDAAGQAFWLRGRNVTAKFALDTTTTGGTASTGLNINNGAWGGFTCGAGQWNGPIYWCSENAVLTDAFIQINAGGVALRCLKKTFANWALVTNLISVYGEIEFGVT